MSKPIHEVIERALSVTRGDLKPGDLLGDYRLLEQLGAGSFGDVWRAEHASTSRVAAIKVFAPERFDDADQRAAAERFTDGVTAMQRLHEAKSVIQLYEGPSVTKGHLWFAMRFYPHKDLQRWIEQHPDTSYETRLRILDNVLDALEAAHSLGVVHRDVRPGNILIDDAGTHAVLADFDIAYFEEFLRKRETTTAFLGWPRYLPPDIFGASGDKIAAKLRRPGNDLHALSIVALDLLAGSKVSIPEDPKPGNLKELFPLRSATTPYGLPVGTIRRLASFFALALSTRAPRFTSVKGFRLAWTSAVTSTRSLAPLLVVPVGLVLFAALFGDWAYDRFRDAFALRVTIAGLAAILGGGVVVTAGGMLFSALSGAIPPWKQRLTAWVSDSPFLVWLAAASVIAASALGAWCTWPSARIAQALAENAKGCLAVDSQGRVVEWLVDQKRTLLDVRSAVTLKCPETAKPLVSGRSLLTPKPTILSMARPTATLDAARTSPTEFMTEGQHRSPFSLAGIRAFTEQGTTAPAWNTARKKQTIELPSPDSPRLVIVREGDVDLGERLLAEGLVRVDPTRAPPPQYAEVERQAQQNQAGNWKLIAEQEARRALLARCPEACCAGTPCEEQKTCKARWQCTFCRDGAEATSWRIRLERATLEHPADWTDVKVCLSVGDKTALNCVMRSDAATDLAFFDGKYTQRKLTNAYLLILGTSKAGVEERVAHRPISFRVDADNLCKPWGIGGFTMRNGGVRSVMLSMHGPLPN